MRRQIGAWYPVDGITAMNNFSRYLERGFRSKPAGTPGIKSDFSSSIC